MKELTIDKMFFFFFLNWTSKVKFCHPFFKSKLSYVLPKNLFIFPNLANKFLKIQEKRHPCKKVLKLLDEAQLDLEEEVPKEH